MGDGTYKNPVLYSDYSDPDVIRVRDDFYLIASSFNCTPGIPILHSKDLVNWRIISHVFKQQIPLDVFSKPQHGNGVWAPAIRYHNGEFFVYYPDPDFGIYLVKAKDPSGPWSTPLLIKSAKGWIDPCPFWGEDGQAYLIHAWAGGFQLIHSVCLSADKGEKESVQSAEPIPGKAVLLEATFSADALVEFRFSVDGKQFKTLAHKSTAKPGKWIGAKVGLFAVAKESASRGHADFESFEFR